MSDFAADNLGPVSVSKLSASSQDYLKVLWALCEWSDEPVMASALANRVGVALSTASDAVRRLASQGFVEHTRYGAITLTSEGRTHALATIRRHRLIETFLVEVLGYTWDEVHDEAEVLEHAVSDLMVERMNALLGYPTRDPHGDPIPAPSGVVEKVGAVRLSDCGPGQKVRVERVSDENSQLLQLLATHGINYGAELELLEAPPFSDSVLLQAEGGERIPLGNSAAAEVWVVDATESARSSPAQ